MITVLRCYFCPPIFRKYSMSFEKFSWSIFQKSLSISQKSALGENAIFFWEFQNILTILTHETRNACLQRLSGRFALARYSPRQSPRYSPFGWVWSAPQWTTSQNYSRSGDQLGERLGEYLGEYQIFSIPLFIGISAWLGEYGEYVLKFVML